MSVILVMIPAAILLAGLGVWAFIVAAKRGQFDDLDTPALRAVFDDDDGPITMQKEDTDAQPNTRPDDADPNHNAHRL
ncbi:MAG: cbb3-type cytochrome oxidase assembly protein CcoS [Phycisphaerales bacterium JB047]